MKRIKIVQMKRGISPLAKTARLKLLLVLTISFTFSSLKSQAGSEPTHSEATMVKSLDNTEQALDILAGRQLYVRIGQTGNREYRWADRIVALEGFNRKLVALIDRINKLTNGSPEEQQRLNEILLRVKNKHGWIGIARLTDRTTVPADVNFGGPTDHTARRHLTKTTDAKGWTQMGVINAEQLPDFYPRLPQPTLNAASTTRQVQLARELDRKRMSAILEARTGRRTEAPSSALPFASELASLSDVQLREMMGQILVEIYELKSSLGLERPQPPPADTKSFSEWNNRLFTTRDNYLRSLGPLSNEALLLASDLFSPTQPLFDENGLHRFSAKFEYTFLIKAGDRQYLRTYKNAHAIASLVLEIQKAIRKNGSASALARSCEMVFVPVVN